MVSTTEHLARPIALDAWQAVVRSSRVLFGAGRLADLGPLAAELGAHRALVVTDPGVAAAGHVARAVQSLRAAGVETAIFDAVVENPTTEHVEAAAAMGRAERSDFLVGLGGGSALDCAKGTNFLLTNGGRMEDYRGFNRAPLPMLSSIGVPTTAGTGSEAQSYALISSASSHVKMACGDEKARFAAVVLDPLLLRTAPRAVTAVAGYDALSHAVESQVAKSASPLSRLFSREAWRLLERSFEMALDDCGKRATAGARSRDVAASAASDIWGDLLLGAHLAGAAIELSMLGAAHACANPLTARFGTTHGIAVGLMLPAVVRLNAAVAGAGYAELIGGDARAAGERLAARLESLRAAAELPARLAEVGVSADALSALTADAAKQWTLQHNPRELGEPELVALYRSVL